MMEDPFSPNTPTKPHLFQQRSRFNSTRTYSKFGFLVVTCLFLGYTASQLYTGHEPATLTKGYTAPSRVVLGPDGKLVNENEQNFKEYSSPNSEARFESNVLPKTSAKSGSLTKGLHDTLSNGVSKWNEWRLGSSSPPPPPLSHDSTSTQTEATSQLPGSGYREVDEEVYTSQESSSKRPTVGKITIVTGGDNDIYERAIRTHEAHNKMHGYPLHALRQSILNDVWSKPAYILSVILRELAKPKAERLQWLFWVDADTVILNPYIPAEIFLPPEDWSEVHMLVSHDYNGLNNGVFPIRVHPWSVELLTAVLAYPHYNPDTHLLFRDQSAMGLLLEERKFKKHTLLAPQRWFNAYQGEVNETIAPFQVRHGDLLVHFAGVPERDTRMQHWLRRAEEHSDEWEVELRYTSYRSEVKDFWDDMSRQRNERQQQLLELRDKALAIIETYYGDFARFKDRLTEDENKGVKGSVDKLHHVLDDDNTKDDDETIREAMGVLEQAAIPLRAMALKLKKVLIKEAHDLIFTTERTTFINAAPQKVEKDSKEVDAVIGLLKDKLVEEQFKPDQVRALIEELRIKHKELLTKINAIAEEEERAMLPADSRPAAAAASIAKLATPAEIKVPKVIATDADGVEYISEADADMLESVRASNKDSAGQAANS